MEMSPVQRMEDSKKMRKILGFCDYVKRRLLRFRDQSLTVKEFKLKVNCSGLDHISNDVDNLIKMACECGVEVIEYSHYRSRDQDQYHVLPMCVIEAKSLTKLELWGDIKIDSAFMNHSIMFFPLRILLLWYVLFGDEHAINRIISFCPLIESISLKLCYVLSSSDGTKEKMKSLSISGLQKLKRIDVEGIRDVSVDAPSLENLCYCPYGFDAPCKIEFNSCRNLKALWMWSVKGTFFTTEWFLELLPKFPFLESLKLDECKMPERIDISCVRLKVLELSDCFNLKEVHIDAPNLLSCRYEGSGASKPTMSFLRNSSQLEVNIEIDINYVDLCDLREFMQNIKLANNVLISLSISIIDRSNVDALDLVALQVSCPPPCIKHLDVHLIYITEEYLFPSIVDFLLTSCCPASISLRFSCYFSGKLFTKLFFETLMERKYEECYCTSDNTRCWWHGLKDVKVTSSMKNKDNFKTILRCESQKIYQERIIFMLDF